MDRIPEVLIQTLDTGASFTGVDPVVNDERIDVQRQAGGRVVKFSEGSQGGRYELPYSASGATLHRFDFVGPGSSNVEVSVEEADVLNSNAAYGEIQVVAASRIDEEETFTVGSADESVTFTFTRFDRGRGREDRKRFIYLQEHQSAQSVAQAVARKINTANIDLDLGIRAHEEPPTTGGTWRVVLDGNAGGTSSNVSMAEDVSDSDFTVTGMSGGTDFPSPCPRYEIIDAVDMGLNPESFSWETGNWGVLIPPGWKLIVETTDVLTGPGHWRAKFGKGWVHSPFTEPDILGVQK